MKRVFLLWLCFRNHFLFTDESVGTQIVHERFHNAEDDRLYFGICRMQSRGCNTTGNESDPFDIGFVFVCASSK